MQRYIVSRLLQAVVVLLIVSIFVFILVRLIPGDPATVMLGEYQDASVKKVLLKQWGLDQPLPVQYVVWLGNVAKGNLGYSLRSGESVAKMIADRAPVSASLNLFAMAIAILIGIPAGVVAATRHRTRVDYAATILGVIGLCIPGFWLALILVLVFAVWLRVLPALGWVPIWVDPVGGLKALLLPAISLGVTTAAIITRMTRASMLEVLREDYVRTARAKGLAERIVIYTHAMRNAWLPVITVIGLGLGHMLGGSVIMEEIFGLPGMGKLLVWGIWNREYPVVQGTVLVFTTWFVLINLLVDLSYSIFDPRIRYG